MRLHRTAVILAALALPLAACSDSTSETEATPTVSVTEATTEAPAEPTDEPDSTDQAEPTEQPESTDQPESAGEAGKPSREDMKAGMARLLADMGMDAEAFEVAGVTEEQVDGYYQCIIDNAYDEVSADFVAAIAAGDQSAEISEEDGQIFNAAVDACADKLAPSE